MDEMHSRLEARLQALETTKAVDAVHRDNVECRVSQIEDTLKWLVRLIIGSMIAGLLAYILKGGLIIA